MQYCSTEPCSSLGNRAAQLRQREIRTCSTALLEPRPLLGRIESESEPPNLATEKNAGRGVFWAWNRQSPVRMRPSRTRKTPRNRGNFSANVWTRAGSLCNSRLDGGENRIRTHGTSHERVFLPEVWMAAKTSRKSSRALWESRLECLGRRWRHGAS